MAGPTGSIGQILGHYRILGPLGAGGMGVVYRARDLRLERDVALKVLPADALADDDTRRRFRREALALSRLSHPNIAQVYDFDSQDDVDYLVMELVAGAGLDQKLAAGAMPERDTIKLGAQLADGLAAAHQQGIIHRDLKPANLRLTPEGRLKILDFGLARVLPHEPEFTLSNTANAAGTLPYMAPEQLRGEPVDARSDIYATGAVLYEMATGRRPHPQQGPHVVEAILNRPPEPPTRLNPRLSLALEFAILKALEKDPARRYQSARELQIDLERSATPSSRVSRSQATPKRLLWPVLISTVLVVASLVGWLLYRDGRTPQSIHSVAVLPLENLSRDPDQDYFADGMTEELITDLSHIRALRVISRTSSMQYKNVRKSMPEIARELNVDAIVEGAVERSGNRVRISAQLIYAPTDTHLWANSYERKLGDVLALQDEVANAIAQEIGIKLTPNEQAQLQTNRLVDPEAHEMYLRGLYHIGKRTDQELETASRFFQQAIARDPQYALAYAGLADVYALRGTFLYMAVPPKDVMPEGKAAALKALQLDPDLAEVHATLAYIEMTYDRNWQKSEVDFKRAIELNPSYAQAHHWYALYLAVNDRRDEAVAEVKRAWELDPLSPIIQTNVGWILYYAGRYDEALAQYRRVLELNPSFFVVHWELGLVYEQKGLYEQARSEFQKARVLSPGNAVILASLADADAASGRKAEAEKILRDLNELSKQRFVSPYVIAELCAALGKQDRAFQFLQRAYDERDSFLVILKVDPRFKKVRSDRRFKELLQQINLSR